MQTKLGSFLESMANTLSAFLLSIAVYQFIVPPVWGLRIDMWSNFGITLLFTVLSIARNYLWRRMFNKGVKQ